MVSNRCLTVLKPYEGEYKNFGVFDIETSKESAKDFRLGCIIVNGFQYRFSDKNEMLTFLLKDEYIGYRWYAHNVEYDLSGFYKNILTIPESKILMNGSRFIELKIIKSNIKNGIDKRTKNKKQKTKKTYIRFWDTFNLIPLSLKKIGKIFNLPKLKYQEMEIENNTDAAFEYCLRDCEITHLIVERYHQYCEKFNISPKLTTSSTALAIFRTNFLKEKIWIDDNDLFFKNSYVGGRTEVIQKRMINGYHYDVNSLYPAAMSKDYYPNPSKIKKGIISNFNFNLENFEGCAYVKIESTNSHIPILPYHHEGKIIYPNGVFEGWYNFNELRFAISRGYKILEVKEYYFSERMKSPFKEYIDFWFKLKNESKNDAGFYDFCKRMQNGLYGKFGEYHDSGTWGNIADDPRTKEEIEKYLDIFDLYFFDESKEGFGTWRKKGETLKEQVTDHTIFSWCSYVTSYARIILYEELERSGLNTVAYMDTDSKFTTTYQENSDKLGEMKTEHENIDCYFQAPKMYQIVSNIECRDYIYYVIEKSQNKNEYKLKGVKLGNKNIFQKSYSQKRVIKSKEALRRGLEAGKWVTIIKEPSGIDTKRVWYKDGTSEPIRIMPEDLEIVGLG
jgi:hypothetical protein